MYGDVVLGVDHHEFEDVIQSHKRDNDYALDTDITADGWREIVAEYKELVERELGRPFPVDPKEQLWGAISAVFGSWMVPRAVTYRRIHEISDKWGTAVNVQSMVFGNMGDDCATGVAFTRDPSTGENYFYGEYLINAQGEDVVAGIRTRNRSPNMAAKKKAAICPRWKKLCLKSSHSLMMSAPSWKITSAIFRIWNSLSRAASSLCCKPETANAPPLPR